MTISEISAEIERLEALKKVLVRQDEAKFLEDAKSHIGRCFRISGHKYVKVLDVPQYEPTLRGNFLNTHQFPGVIIDLEKPVGFSKHPFMDNELGLELDKIFSGCWGQGKRVDKCEEISKEEFEMVFNERLEEIKSFVLR